MMSESKNTKERLQKERNFHNEAFSSGTRKVAKKYYKSAERSKAYYRSLLMKNIRGKKVLEYGCGPGSAAFELAKAGADVTGIDISDVAIQQSKERAKREGLNINFQVMDAENLDFKDATFDLICGSGILHHLELEKAYREIRRTLKSSGRAVFFEPLGHNPVINLYRKLTPKMRTEDEHPLLMSDLERAENYFQEINLSFFNLTSIASTFIPVINSYLSRFDDYLFEVFPKLKKYAWIVVIEFK